MKEETRIAIVQLAFMSFCLGLIMTLLASAAAGASDELIERDRLRAADAGASR